MNKTLDHLYHSLLFCLGQEYEHYLELINVIRAESDILVRCNLDEILEFNTQKERVLLSLNVAMEMRIEATNKIVAHLALEKPVMMRQLIAYAQDHIRQELNAYQEKFSELLSEIARINASNKNLITFSISNINNTLHYINSLSSQNHNYDHCGRIKAGNLHGRLISQEG